MPYSCSDKLFSMFDASTIADNWVQVAESLHPKECPFLFEGKGEWLLLMLIVTLTTQSASSKGASSVHKMCIAIISWTGTFVYNTF